jgi:hypothetical protein
MFYGVGGIGKSWLLRRLRETVSVPPELPTALIDFDPAIGGASYMNDRGFALAEIRR